MDDLIEQKARAFDALVRILQGNHKKLDPPRQYFSGSLEDDTFHVIPEYTYEWHIRVNGSTDIQYALLKLGE